MLSNDSVQRAAGRMATLWAYFRNTMSPVSPIGGGDCGRTYRLAQERGLPGRVLGTWDKRSKASRMVAVINPLGQRTTAVFNATGKQIASVNPLLNRCWIESSRPL